MSLVSLADSEGWAGNSDCHAGQSRALSFGKAMMDVIPERKENADKKTALTRHP